MDDKVWVCAHRLISDEKWELIGVHASERRAIDACKGRADYYIGAVYITGGAFQNPMPDVWLMPYPVEQEHDPDIPPAPSD